MFETSFFTQVFGEDAAARATTHTIKVDPAKIKPDPEMERLIAQLLERSVNLRLVSMTLEFSDGA